jgi:predicted alpha/beta-fold hydrolase
VTIITSQDDPFIDVDDFRRLPKNQHLHLLIQKHGGHCGFLDPFPYQSWYERTIFKMIQDDKQGRQYG